MLLIEKMTILGGNSLICGGNFACPGNPNQKKLGIKDSREIFIGDCTRDGLGINHVELLDVIYDRCNDVVALLRKYGCTVDDSHLASAAVILRPESLSQRQATVPAMSCRCSKRSKA